MDALRRFLAILSADLRERSRTPRFWIVLLGMAVAVWWCIPAIDAGYTTVTLSGQERGRYSSAWVGMVMALEFSTLLSLFGFYLVRGTVVRDIETRVWQLLVATPMTRGGYLLAKWASHMAVFGLVVGTGLAVGLVAQLVRAEDSSIDLWELLKPTLLLSLPGLAVTAMLAVWFDLLPWLRRTAGNVIFFILWVTLTSVSIAQLESSNSDAVRDGWRSDPNGIAMVARDLHRVREAQTGLPRDFGFSVGVQMHKQPPTLFEWPTWTVRPMDLFGRALWLGIALLGVLAAAPVLDWAAARGGAPGKVRSAAGRRLAWLDRLLDPLARGHVGRLAIAELKLVLRQRRVWWWLAVLLAFGLQLFGARKPFEMGLLLAWILPLDILARSILRERDNGTGALVFNAPGILPRLLAARLLAGIGLLVALTFPGLVRLAIHAPMGALAMLAISASIATVGLSLGALFRNARLFELLLVGAVYVGLQGATLFDVSIDPQATLIRHLLLALPAGLLLAWSWPRLARR